MSVDECVNYSILNAKKIRNELIENLIKEEDYRKKDEKKKEIVKSCNSYKDFCNIVECVNMKPIKKYENKIKYDDYVNSRYNVSHWKTDTIQKKKNVNDSLAFIKNQIKQLSKKNRLISPDDLKKKSSHETQQFIQILKSNKKDYHAYITSTYNCDDIKDVILFIKKNTSVLFNYNCNIEPPDKITQEESKQDNFSLVESLIDFLFSLSQYWQDQQFSSFFNTDELNAIYSDCDMILEEIKEQSKQFLCFSNEMLQQVHFIKYVFSKEVNKLMNINK